MEPPAREGRKSALSALQRLLCCPVTASPGASACSPRTGTQDPSPAVKTPLHDLLWPSGPPRLNPTKAARLWLPHSQQGHPDLAQGSGREEVFLVSDAEGGDTTITGKEHGETLPLPEDFRICRKRRGSGLCSHLIWIIRATSRPRIAGGCGGEGGKKSGEMGFGAPSCKARTGLRRDPMGR